MQMSDKTVTSNLDEILNLAFALSPQERAELIVRVATTLKDEWQTRTESLRGATPEERIRLMDQAALAIRQDLSDSEWAAIEQAMNSEYIEPLDEALWKD
jgi:uncharacterized protein YeeX (DUF496 family)